MPHLAADLADRRPKLSLLERIRDLFFREAGHLHRLIPRLSRDRCGTEFSALGWPGYQGVGQS